MAVGSHYIHSYSSKLPRWSEWVLTHSHNPNPNLNPTPPPPPPPPSQLSFLKKYEPPHFPSLFPVCSHPVFYFNLFLFLLRLRPSYWNKTPSRALKYPPHSTNQNPNPRQKIQHPPKNNSKDRKIPRAIFGRRGSFRPFLVPFFHSFLFGEGTRFFTNPFTKKYLQWIFLRLLARYRKAGNRDCITIAFT